MSTIGRARSPERSRPGRCHRHVEYLNRRFVEHSHEEGQHMSGSLLRKVWHGFAARVSVGNSDVSSVSTMSCAATMSCVSTMTAKRRATISRRLLPVVLGLCACLTSATPAGAMVRYVDDDAVSGGDGPSWATADANSQDTLTQALDDPSISAERGDGGRLTPESEPAHCEVQEDLPAAPSVLRRLTTEPVRTWSR